jgi:uncharacterized Zn finger protein (UPF0148 family)
MFCENCGKNLPDTAVFCPACGESTGTEPDPRTPPASANPIHLAPAPDASDGDEIVSLMRSVAQNPDDESYTKLLAIALHDDAMKEWWEDLKGKSLVCVSRESLVHAQKQLKRASELRSNDPEVRKEIEKTARLVASMEERKFAGSWLMVVVLSFFVFIPGIVWWYVNRRPRYLINRDYMMHAKTGKHIGAAQKMGGLQGKVYEFFEKLSDDWGWLMGLGFMLTVGVVLSPIFMILAYKENYLDLKKATA